MAQNASPSASFTNDVEASNEFSRARADSADPRRPMPLDYVARELHSVHHQSLDELREEIALLRAQIATLQSRASSILATATRRANASAQAQLGHHPWLKLAAIMGTTFVVSRALRRVPFAALASGVGPGLALLLGPVRERR
jgi:BMFP domain-containing protein YqiC